MIVAIQRVALIFLCVAVSNTITTTTIASRFAYHSFRSKDFISMRRLSGMGVTNRHTRGWCADLSWFVKLDCGDWRPMELKDLIDRSWQTDGGKRLTITIL